MALSKKGEYYLNTAEYVLIKSEWDPDDEFIRKMYDIVLAFQKRSDLTNSQQFGIIWALCAYAGKEPL